MTSDRYLPRAPSLRPAPKRRANILPEPPMTYEEVRNKFVLPNGKDALRIALANQLATAKAPPSLPAPGAGVQSRVPPLPLADLPAPPARGPWEPKED